MAAWAFIDANVDEFRNKTLSIASDSVTVAEARQRFARVLGEVMPMNYWWVAWVVKLVLREQLGTMLDWFATDGVWCGCWGY